MDIPILLAIVASLAIIVYLAYSSIVNKKAPADNVNPQQPVAQEPEDDEVEVVQGRRRGLQQRNRPIRPATRVEQPATAIDQEQDELQLDEDEEDTEEVGADGQKKIGKKKLAKLQMKEERRKQKEAEDAMKEERKKRQEQELEEQKLESEKRKEQERAIELEEEKRLLEKKQREEEEYNQWKGLIAVEETGTVQQELEAREKRMGEFIQYVKDNKVVLLEDLAVEFSMKTHEVIEKLKQFDEEGKVSGVIDDRGKFIYITREEMEKVAEFIHRKGRVTIEDIARESNRLVNLNPPKQ